MELLLGRAQPQAAEQSRAVKQALRPAKPGIGALHGDTAVMPEMLRLSAARHTTDLRLLDLYKDI